MELNERKNERNKDFNEDKKKDYKKDRKQRIEGAGWHELCGVE